MPAPALRTLPRPATAALLATLLGACQPATDSPAAPPSRDVLSSRASALDALAGLAVRRSAAPVDLPDYRRVAFGDGWADLDRDGCDTRQEVLRRDLREVRFRADDPGCTVDRGTLRDPFSGREIDFARGPETSDDVQIDHVVALADAWRSGATTWNAERRERFANDGLELLAVDGELNQRKGARDAARWLPPSGRCAYVARQVAVKATYGLSVSSEEAARMQQVLRECPEDLLE